MTNHNLHCDHVAGTDELIDLLGDGALDAPWQERLAVLVRARIYPGAAGPKNDYRTSDVTDYETEPTADGYIETWECPDCGHVYYDERDEDGVDL